MLYYTLLNGSVHTSVTKSIINIYIYFILLYRNSIVICIFFTHPLFITSNFESQSTKSCHTIVKCEVVGKVVFRLMSLFAVKIIKD